MKRIVVLASGSGSNLQALIDAAATGALPAEIVAVISDRPGAGALARAERAGIPAITLPLARRRDPAARAAHDALLAETLATFDPDLVVLAGWMLILGDAVLSQYPERIVNVHPALLPEGTAESVATSCGQQPALRGAHAVADALARGLPVTGATVHLVTSLVDCGPILLREEVPILAGDDPERLHERIKRVEHDILPRAVARMLVEQEAEGATT